MDAILRLKMEGAQAVLQDLKNINAAMDALKSGMVEFAGGSLVPTPAAGARTGGGVPVASTGLPPAPTTSVTAASGTAAVAGGPGVGAAKQQVVAQSSTSSAVGAQAMKGAGLEALLTPLNTFAFMMGSGIRGSFEDWSRSAAAGTNSHPWAAFANSLPIVSGFYSDALNRYTAELDMRYMAHRVGYSAENVNWSGLTTDMIPAITRDLAHGRALPISVYETISRAGGNSPELRQAILEVVGRGAFQPDFMLHNGLPKSGDKWSPGKTLKAIIAGSYGHELEAKVAIDDMQAGNKPNFRNTSENIDWIDSHRGWVNEYKKRTGHMLAASSAEDMEKAYNVYVAEHPADELSAASKQMEDDFKSRVGLEEASSADALEATRAGYKFGFAIRHGLKGQRDASAGRLNSALQAEIKDLQRQEAQARKTGENETANQFAAKRAALEDQLEQQIPEALFSALQADNSALSALGLGRAGRAISLAQFEGKGVSETPYAELRNAYLDKARRLESERDEKRRQFGSLSEAEEAQYAGEIEQARFDAKVTVKRQQINQWIGERSAAGTLAGTDAAAKLLGGTLYGSAAEQAVGQVDMQLVRLREQKAVLQEILQLREGLTKEQRLQYQNQVAQLGMDEKILGKAREIAKIAAEATTYAVSQQVGVLGPAQRAMLRGVGGAEYSVQADAIYQANIGLVTSSQRKLNSLRASGLAEDSSEVLGAKGELDAAMTRAEQARAGLAQVPLSGHDQAKQIQLETEAMVYESGYGGSVGAIRKNLIEQMEIQRKGLRDLNAERDKLISEGSFTPQMDAAMAQQAAGFQRQLLNLQQRFDFGWQERLISQTYNLSGQQGLIGRARLTPLEAARAGVMSEAFGGSRLDMTHRMAQQQALLLSGNPDGFNQRALGIADQVASAVGGTQNEVVVRVIIEDSKGNAIKEHTQVVIDGIKSAANIFVNPNKRPSA